MRRERGPLPHGKGPALFYRRPHMPQKITTANVNEERGQTMAELALVLPVLLVLLLGIAQFGVTFNNYISLTDAVRAGARGRQSPATRRIRRAPAVARVLASAGSLNTTESGEKSLVHVVVGIPGADVTVTPTTRSTSAAELECPKRPFRLHDEGACGMSRSWKNQDGQAIVLMAISLDRVHGHGGAGARRRPLDAYRPQASADG